MPGILAQRKHFEFSQSSLQDFTDCQKRFFLRYVRRVAWPAVQAEPAREHERHIMRGQRFHRLAQQYLVGVPEDRLTGMAAADEDPRVLAWWQNFLDCVPESLAGERFAEVMVEDRLGSFRLVAKYDLVLLNGGGQVVIYDWKTSPKKPPRNRLLERLQTRVYPYLMARAGAALLGRETIRPDQIQMVYWFAEPGLAPEVIPYSPQRFEQDGCHLLDLMNRISTMNEDDFQMCGGENTCAFCVYRSLCRRGGCAGSLDGDETAGLYDAAGLDDFAHDLEQVGEIRF